MRIAEEQGVDAEIRLYLKQPPGEAELREIIAKLTHPATELVRRDSLFAKLGLTDDDVATDDQVVAILVKHKQLLQRPLIVLPDKAFVGRPKERVSEALTDR